MMPSKQIRVDKSNWKKLNSMKDPGEDFNDVVEKLIDEVDYHRFVVGVEQDDE